MFTGLIETVGTIVDLRHGDGRATMTIDSPHFAGELVHGESVSVNGVCVTVASMRQSQWSADLMNVTLETTTLGVLQPGSRVNLERAVRADSRLGGHIVQGHVDARGTVVSVASQPEWDDVTVEVPDHITRYVVPKGSIAIDGVSLTVARLEGQQATVSLIPTTLEDTTLGNLAEGASVNIEVDILGKYVERLMNVPSA